MKLSTSLSLGLITLTSNANTEPTQSNFSGVRNLINVRRAVPEQRIVGGYEVDPAFMYPFLVSLQRFQMHLCGGTFYGENTVITAAHCTVGDDVEGFDVSIHRHNLALSDREENGVRRKVVERIRHPEYKRETEENDIAIWKLAPSKDKSTPFVKSISLDDGSVPKDGRVLTRVAGWGSTKAGGPHSKKLYEVKLPFYDMNKCFKKYSEQKIPLDPKRQICAGFPEGGKDACQGDSGGPLFVKKGSKFIMVGIVSWGIGCAAPDVPGIYTRIEYYRDWIDQHTS